MKYKCLACGAVHKRRKWNKMTKKVFGEPITPLEKEMSIEGYFFACPTCRTEQSDFDIERI